MRKRWVFLAAALALTACLWEPASAHLRAAKVLARFGDKDAGPPPGVTETKTVIARDGAPAISARVYAKGDAKGAPALVFAHGVHHLGIEEPRLVRFARAIASSGVVVSTPELSAIADYRVDPREIDVLGAAAHDLRVQTGHPVGLMGMSFAGGLALLAAADARYAGDIAFVVAVGAHDDLARVSKFFATNHIPRPDGSDFELKAHDYGALVLVYSHVQDFFPPEDAPVAKEALKAWLWEDREPARETAKKLSPASKAKIERLFDRDLAVIAPELLAECDREAAAMAAVSPHGRLGSIRAPVYLLHGTGDSVIPSTESLWLAADAPASLVRDVVISPAVVHVELEGEPGAREQWRVVHFMAEILEEADRE